MDVTDTGLGMHACMHVCMYVCVRVSMRTYVTARHLDLNF
jgi:hypothetical protein